LQRIHEWSTPGKLIHSLPQNPDLWQTSPSLQTSAREESLPAIVVSATTRLFPEVRVK
jgi:hypothetical protein